MGSCQPSQVDYKVIVNSPVQLGWTHWRGTAGDGGDGQTRGTHHIHQADLNGRSGLPCAPSAPPPAPPARPAPLTHHNCPYFCASSGDFLCRPSPRRRVSLRHAGCDIGRDESDRQVVSRCSDGTLNTGQGASRNLMRQKGVNIDWKIDSFDACFPAVLAARGAP